VARMGSMTTTTEAKYYFYGPCQLACKNGAWYRWIQDANEWHPSIVVQEQASYLIPQAVEVDRLTLVVKSTAKTLE